MEYVKVIADTQQEAHIEAQRKYGNNIILMNHKEIIEGGLFGHRLFGKKRVELTVALPEKDRLDARKISDSMKQDTKLNDLMKLSKDSFQTIKEPINTVNGEMGKSVEKTGGKSTDAPIEKNKNYLGKQAQPAKDPGSALQALMKYQETRSLLMRTDSLAGQEDDFADKKSGKSHLLENSVSKDLGKNKSSDGYQEIVKGMDEIRSMLTQLQQKGVSIERHSYQTPLDRWEQKLLEADFSAEYTDILLHEVRGKLSVDEINNREIIRKKLLQTIKNRIGIATPLMKKGEKRKVAAFIGATGVGKTTTLAKLGAIYTFYENKKVTFITIDNYRVAATEQLKRYASIINIPTLVVNSDEQLAKVVSEDDSDLLLIDTSGRSPYNKAHLEEMQAMFRFMKEPVEKILVTSATSKRSDQKIIFENFSVVGIDKVIFSKLDESTAIGGLIEVADNYNKGISYVTFGQDVPTDIEEAKWQRLAFLAIGDRERPVMSEEMWNQRTATEQGEANP